MKKMVIVWCCVACAIIAVLGLEDNLTYEGLQKASEMIQVRTDSVKSEVSYLQVVTACTEIYNPNEFQDFHLKEKPTEDNSGYVPNTYVIVKADGALGFGGKIETVADDVFLEADDVPKVRSMLFFLSHSRATAMNELLTVLNLLCFYITALFNILLDSLPVVFAVLRAGLFLLGF